MTQNEAFQIMKTGVNIYLTGSAGSGKTFLLNQYIKYCKDHNINVACTASTGIASTHMNGMTIHGWAGIGIRESLNEHDLDSLEEKKYLWSRFDKTKVLIIDEVSMLHAHRLDMVNRVCKRFKRNNKPFGGLQVILCGDFFQLPPVNKNNNINSKDMVMESSSWIEMNPAICYLTDQYRQEDNILTDILNNIRNNSIDDKHIGILKGRLNINLAEHIEPTRLYTHNVNVDLDNEKELDKIKEEGTIFQMKNNGPDILVDILKKSCLAQEKLVLKNGAEVMFIKNNYEQGYVNGTRGKVIGFSEDFDNIKMPIIKLYNGRTINVVNETWSMEENGKVKASIETVPLRLAWAITIHKSQGMSLDNAQIDLSATFSYGMGYVALSRVRTLSGIKLLGFTPDSLLVDPAVLAFDAILQKESESNRKLFGNLKKEEQVKLENDFIVRCGGILKSQNINKKNKNTQKNDNNVFSTIETTRQFLDKGMNIKAIAKERNLTAGTITAHIEQLVGLYPDIKIIHLKPKQKIIDQVINASKKVKDKEEIGKLSPIKKILEKEGIDMTFEDIRLARLFI